LSAHPTFPFFGVLNKRITKHFLNCFICRGAEDVELWFTEVENLLALEDVGKVSYWWLRKRRNWFLSHCRMIWDLVSH